MGSDDSHFNVSLIVMDKVTRRCPQTTTFEERGEPKQIRTEVPLLTSLTPYRFAKPARSAGLKQLRKARGCPVPNKTYFEKRERERERKLGVDFLLPATLSPHADSIFFTTASMLQEKKEQATDTVGFYYTPTPLSPPPPSPSVTLPPLPPPPLPASTDVMTIF